MNSHLQIVSVHPDPLCEKRMLSGRFRINRELNEEWIDILNQSEYVLNLQKRVLMCCQILDKGFKVLKQAILNSPRAIALYPGQKIRIFTGEQPPTSTHIPDGDRVSQVLWLVQQSYLWLPEGNEARLYFSQYDMKEKRPPLARYRY